MTTEREESKKEKAMIMNTNKTWEELFDEMNIGDTVRMSSGKGIFEVKKVREINFGTLNKRIEEVENGA